MYQSEQINELATALAKAQSEFVPAVKDSSNPYFKSKYANLCSIVRSCQEPLCQNGISFSQSTQKLEGEWVLITKLMHSSGQWIQSITPIITLKPDIQAFGSAITYARRYALAAIAGVTTDEDDDGEAATAPSRKPKEVTVPFESPEMAEANFSNFLSDYDDEDHEQIRAYIKKYATHWSKTTTQALNDYRDKSKFMKDFEKWKEKSQKKVA